MKVFSTITSPVFSELTILVRASGVTRAPFDVTLFETLRTMNQARPLRLVFLLITPDPLLGEARQKLEGAFDSVATRCLLDFLDSPPIIRSARSPELRWYSQPRINLFGVGLETGALVNGSVDPQWSNC
jgi:hypothetical protein